MTRASPDAALPDGIGSQTLDRGLRVLDIVAAGDGLGVTEIAELAGLHRSITYRMVRTLEHRGLVERDGGGRYTAGARLAGLARHVAPTLRGVAAPRLAELAERTRRTAFLVVASGDLAVTVHVEEPRTTIAHVAYRPGLHHPLTLGAPGLALLAGRPPVDGEREEVTWARGRGWAQSHGEVIPDYRSCAAPVHDHSGSCVAAVAVVFVGAEPPSPDLAADVVATARSVGAALPS
jgi:DNA-binding IclR family transcriptional regulator